MVDNSTGENSEPAARIATLPQGFNLSMQGWINSNENEQREFGNKLYALISIISESINLQTLESVIVTMDYQKSLSELDRGFGEHTLSPTKNVHGEGHAMTVHLNRDGKLKSAVIIATFLIQDVFSQDNEKKRWALHTLVHELAHVEHDALQDERKGGNSLTTQFDNNRQQNLMPAVSPFQSEFYADYTSAHHAPDLGLFKVDMLGKVMLEFQTYLPARRLRYRIFSGLDEFWIDIESKIRFLFQSLGYALGFTHGIEAWGGDTEIAEKLRDELTKLEGMEVGWIIKACEQEISTFYTEEAFSTLSTFDGLINIAEQLLNQFDVYTGLVEDMFYVSMAPLELRSK